MDEVRVLIVDDEELICKSIASKIGRLNHDRVYHVSYATSVVDALSLFDRIAFDIVITDINMPVLDGFTLVERLRAISDEVKIFIVSGYDHYDYVRKAFLLSVNDYLLKPVAVAELDEKLRMIEGVPAREKSKRSRMIQAVLERVNKDENYRVTLKEIAGEMQVGYAHLSTAFREEMGCGFSSYLIGRRMERARILLEDPSLRISDVAHKLGYEEPNLFSRDYKRFYGESPKKQRKK